MLEPAVNGQPHTLDPPLAPEEIARLERPG